MSNSSQQRLYNATNRLVAALERLELGLQQVTVGRERDVQQHQHLLSYQRENEALLQEQERMQTTILNLQQQYEELQGVASTIYGKLDTSIERLTQILEK
jgi:hypothetical protein